VGRVETLIEKLGDGLGGFSVVFVWWVANSHGQRGSRSKQDKLDANPGPAYGSLDSVKSAVCLRSKRRRRSNRRRPLAIRSEKPWRDSCSKV